MARGRADEFRIQSECVKWLWNEKPETRRHFILIDNNSDSAVQALQKRAMGQIKGVADTLFFWKKKLYFIEFKTELGKQSQDQIAFEIEAYNHCDGYIIIRSIEQFKTFINSVLSSI